jgi:hypothetical protein
MGRPAKKRVTEAVMVVRLTEENERKLDALSRATGKPPEQLVNEAVEMLTSAASPKHDWKTGWKRAAGIWKDRNDLDPQEIRRSWEREFPYRKP